MPGHEIILMEFSAGGLEAKAWLASGLGADLPLARQPASVPWALERAGRSRRLAEGT